MKLLATLAALGVVLLASVSAFGMGTEKATTTVTIKSPAPSTFKGRVSSSSGSCVKGREVKLFQDQPAGPHLVSQGISNDSGVWRVGLEGDVFGHYFVKVKFKRIGSLICKAAHSRDLNIPGG